MIETDIELERRCNVVMDRMLKCVPIGGRDNRTDAIALIRILCASPADFEASARDYREEKEAAIRAVEEFLAKPGKGRLIRVI